MRRSLKFAAGWFRLLSGLMCLALAVISLSITLFSVLGAIKTGNPVLWRRVFAAVFAALCIIALLSAGMYLFAARSKKSLLCALFSGCRLPRYISVLNWEVGALEVVIVFNMLFARFIWQGDGHSVSDNWVFDAGVRPIQFALVCALLAGLQRKVWNIIGEKTGQLKKSPYD